MLTVELPKPHAKQRRFVKSKAKRKVVRGGRRGGKTVGAAYLAVDAFVHGRRVLYATPTGDQIDRFWHEVKQALAETVGAGVYTKNETRHIIELPGTEQRIRAKTAWNADTLRGDYADLLILDEWQLMNEEAWTKVGAPMLLDNNGDVVFIYTPPSLRSRSTSKANDPLHAAKLYKAAKKRMEEGDTRWEVFHFSSHDNPHISREALSEITKDMTNQDYQMEILALDLDDDPNALWSRSNLDDTRVTRHPDLYSIVVGIDPAASTGQGGVIVAGVGYPEGEKEPHCYILADATPARSSKPEVQAAAAVTSYYKFDADKLIAEVNNGGDWIEAVVRAAPNGKHVRYDTVHATRGKHTRAQPISAIWKNGRGHMVGVFSDLEDQLCTWVPGDNSPDRLDAMVWAATALKITEYTEPAGELVKPDLSVYKTQRRKSRLWQQ